MRRDYTWPAEAHTRPDPTVAPPPTITPVRPPTPRAESPAPEAPAQPGPSATTQTSEAPAPTTRDAIRDYQRALGLEITGEPSEELAAHLRQLTGNKN